MSGCEVQRLAVQVGELDVVVVDDPEAPDARAGQIERDRRAERARADHQHARVAQRDLAELRPLRQQQLARVALELVVVEQRVARARAWAPACGPGSRPGRRPRRARGTGRGASFPLAHARTIRITVPSTTTAWPASRAERGTFSTASPGGSVTSSVWPGSSRSSSTLVRTHVIGQRSAVTSSAWTISGTVAARMSRSSYLILHGYQGSGPGHWQTWLAARLRAGDAVVHYPDLPDADAPQLRRLAGRARARAGLDRRAADRHLPLRRLRAVAAPRRRRRQAGRADAAGRAAVAGGRAGRARRVLPGAGDRGSRRADRLLRQRPVLPGGRRGALRRAPADVLPGQGHINPDAGYGPWPAVEAWAREGTFPLTAR